MKTPDLTPIACTLQVDHEVGGPFAIFDGWNRALAWLTGGPERYRLPAVVIKTKLGLVHLGARPPDVEKIRRELAAKLAARGLTPPGAERPPGFGPATR